MSWLAPSPPAGVTSVRKNVHVLRPVQCVRLLHPWRYSFSTLSST